MATTISKVGRLLIKRAKKARRRIGIGIIHPIPETIESLKAAAKYADVVIVGAKIKGFRSIVSSSQDRASVSLVKLLKIGAVEGIVRGQLKDSFTLEEFHRQFGKPPLPSDKKIAPVVLEKGNYSFVAATSSIYQGMTVETKMYEIQRLARYMVDYLGLKPKIAVMSSLRPTSKVGKYPLLDDIALINQKVAARLRRQGHDVKEYYFEYEKAVWDKCTLIVPAMGLVGNAWVKALLYLGDWQLLSCPYLDLGVAYEDGSRNEKEFFWHIVSAVATVNQKQ